MTCLECLHLDLKSYPSHAKAGFGRCKLEKLSGVFVSFSFGRDCNQSKPADSEIIAKRQAWQKKEK